MTALLRAPLLERYVVREVATHALAGFAIVLGIFLMTRLSSLLSDAAVSGLSGVVVVRLLVLRTAMALPSLLPAVLYIGVLLAINRMARDRELLAMETAGVGPWRLDLAVLRFALGAAAVIALLSFVGRPWAATRFNEVRDRAIAEAGLHSVTPGIFYELSSSGREVVFAEARADAGPADLRQVYVFRRAREEVTIYFAESAVESRDAGGSHVMTLRDGVQYDLQPRGEAHSVTEFERLTMRRQPPDGGSRLDAEKTLSVGALAAMPDPEARAELQWRIALPVSGMLLCLLAVPLGRTDPRAGRMPRVFLAALLYVVYRTMLGSAKSWVAGGVVPPALGLWSVHAACLVTALGLGHARGLVRR